ncbi:MAG: hypothetical protein GWN61_20055 [candidate division Zixibacteria bacterium]|nr:hypothetical protein [candidate division Zixibacteria bacterium]NIS48166.1 hypothetical protein [candidate division Zixibacteria bacterium]NIU16282.1 hypothetical protein [candidate division Zixibacteria bacterium]NIV08407.1 hypothetical protein [candidate division Zixibacteria bacterium]NIW96797.1 hypothetical protein [Phycisphaerae bacterium]
MRSPITRTAAMITVIVSAFWAYYQIGGNSDGTPTVLYLLNAATAAENAWFAGEQTVHIVNRIVISPQHDANDLGILMENLESNFDKANFDAFYRRLLTPRGMEFFSLDPNGHRHNHHLELVDPQAGKATIEDHIWYDPSTGRYARLLTRTDRVLFAHSFDGHHVYLAQRDDQGKLIIQSDPVTASFSAPKNLAGFLGSTTAEVRKLLEIKDILIRGKPTESTIRGKAVHVYKLSYLGIMDMGSPYVQLSVDKNDQSIVRIEFIANQKTALTIDHLSMTPGVLPSTGWDLSALPGSHKLPITDVTVRHETGRTGLTVQEMAERATFPVFIFGKDPYGTVHRTISESIDPVSQAERLFVIMYETQHEVAVGLFQCRTLDRYVKAQTKNVNLQTVQAIITTSNGFKVHDLDANVNAFILNLLFASLDKKAAENRNCYLLESPDGQFMFLGVDGWLPSNELEQLTESLVSAQDYVPNNESIPKTVVDLNLATQSTLEQRVIPWLLLGRFDFNAYSSEPAVEKARKLAFDDEIPDLSTFTPEVRVQDKEYAWTSCYGQTINYQNYGQSINLGAVYGTSSPGICYGRTRIIMSERTEAVLGIGSPDAVKIWLNGRLIHEVWGKRGAWPDTDLVPVTLRPGENHLVFKTMHSHGNEWRLFCHFKEGNKVIYAPTMEERTRGFIAVQGNSRPEPRPRLQKLEVDLGRNERDLVPVKLVSLSELDTVSISVSGPGAALCTSWIEKDYQLRAGDRAPLRLPNPPRIWLEVDSHKHDPGVYELTVSLSSGQGTELRIPGTVTIHDVALPEERTVGMNPHVCVVNLSWGAGYKPEARKRLEVFLDDLAMLRNTVCGLFYTYNPANVLHQVKIAGTDQTLHTAGQAGIIDINNLPDLDFSFFDPWIAGSGKRGMTRLEINGRLYLSEHERAFAKAVLGDDIVCSDEISWKMLMWLHSEFRDYAISRGMTETWAKIDTQLTPETIPDYVQTARRYQTIGYRTYTSNASNFTREATWLNQLNAQNDSWHMGYGNTPSFFELTRGTQGTTAVPLDEGDQVWYNDGGNYNKPYEEGRTKAWRACAIGAHGYTWWIYWWGNSTDQIVWYDQETERIIHSPIWHGLRDGNEDAAYYHMLQQRLRAQGDQEGLARLAALTGKTEDAPLRMIQVSYNGLVCDDIAGPIGFHQFNQAKREVLRMLCTDQ